ncbi:MAG: gliding motility lipoprotein GldH family protein, partial [Bacteroidia bacterium]
MIKTIRNKTFAFALAALLGVMMTSCNKNVVYSKYQTFKDNEWYVKDKAVFDVDITDTQTLNNINLMVRHADSYPYNNLFVFVTTKYPDGKVLT